VGLGHEDLLALDDGLTQFAALQPVRADLVKYGVRTGLIGYCLACKSTPGPRGHLRFPLHHHETSETQERSAAW
jgi:hypothetical protein